MNADIAVRNSQYQTSEECTEPSGIEVHETDPLIPINRADADNAAQIEHSTPTNAGDSNLRIEENTDLLTENPGLVSVDETLPDNKALFTP